MRESNNAKKVNTKSVVRHSSVCEPGRKKKELTDNRRRSTMADGRRGRSHTGPNPSLINQPHSFTLPRGLGAGSRSADRTISLSAQHSSKDDMAIMPRPYLFTGPKRQAPLPPSKQATTSQQLQKFLPKRRAPPPPPPPATGNTVSPMGTNLRKFSPPDAITNCSDDTVTEDIESLYELPEKSLMSANVTLKPKAFRDPPAPPIPSTPRPSLSHAASVLSIWKAVDEDTESIYEETNCHLSFGSSAPPPPLPPRSFNVQPPFPPLSRPPSFKPPAPDPTLISSSSATAMQSREETNTEQEEYTEMCLTSSAIENQLKNNQVEEEDYIIMEEAVKSRDLYKKEMEEKDELSSTRSDFPSSSTVDHSQIDDYTESEGNYMEMNVPSGSYVKMVHDSLTNAPPIPPKPASFGNSNSTFESEKRFRAVPKQKFSIPRIPPPPVPVSSSPPPPLPPHGVMTEEQPVATEEDTLYEPVSQGETVYY